MCVLPHAFNDFAVSNNVGSPMTSTVGGLLGNTRFVTIYNQGTGLYGDVIKNFTSPLSNRQGPTNSSTAYYTSARVLRCNVRVIPVSPQINRGGYI